MKKGLVLLAAIAFMLGQTSAQNFGIGVTNPTKAKLEVNGGNSTSAIFGGESTGISFRHSLPAIGFNNYHNGLLRHLGAGFSATQTLNFQNGRMLFDMYGYTVADGFANAGKTAIMIIPEGRMSIGGDFAPTTTLRVFKGSAPDGTAVFEGSSHHSFFHHGPEENVILRAGKANGKIFLNDVPGGTVVLAGKVGINTATPEWPLEIRQTNRGLLLQNEANTGNWEWRYGEGGPYHLIQLFYNGTYKGSYDHIFGTHNYVSDARLKTAVQTLPSVLQNLKRLRPVDYHTIGNTASQQKSIGFVAQEVAAVFPDLVTVSQDSTTGHQLNDLHVLNCEAFGTLAIKAVQEQQGLLQLQKEKRQQQRLAIEELKKSLDALTFPSSKKSLQ